MPAIAAAPAFYAALAGGAATVGAASIGARASGSANRRALSASNDAARRAEAFEREQDTRNRADEDRRDAEDRRRWEVEQGNLAREREQADAFAQYEDDIRYGKMLNLARLTGQPAPERPPRRTGMGAPSQTPVIQPRREVSSPMMTAPSRANAMIAPAGEFDPFQAPAPQRMPISRLTRRSY